MSMKTVSRVLVTAVAAPMLAFGLPSAAFADSFFEANATWAGPKGAGSQSVCSAATDHGHHHGLLGYGGGYGKKGCGDHHKRPWAPGSVTNGLFD
ncbi:hypothetical protein [Nocardiopsis sp. LOL_012]|uniref:hypothetical protein n=1 Tax=Nocardiopsis sp. LOL_012 TaxID=3345409 RepID=UPI003A87CE68